MINKPMPMCLALPTNLKKGKLKRNVSTLSNDDVSPFPIPLLPQSAPHEYSCFWQLWQEEKFFECHEVLEDLWRATVGPKRLFYNGLIHCAVALYQQRRGNGWGAMRQLRRAQVKLEAFRPFYEGVNIDELLDWMTRALSPCANELSESQRKQLLLLEESVRERWNQSATRDFRKFSGEST